MTPRKHSESYSLGTQRTHFRPGFTLLEVLLALSLSVVLLTAVYGAFDLYLRLATASSDDIEQAQVARALLRKMAVDIRSVVVRQNSSGTSLSSSSSSSSSSQSSTGSGASGADSGGGAGNASTASNGASTASNGAGNANSANGASSAGSTDPNAADPVATDPAAGFSSSMTGLVGDSQTLVLHVSRGFRLAAGTVDAEGEPTVSADSGQERSISYFLADTGATGLAGLVGEAHRESNSSSGVQGLARLEGNRLLIQLSDEQNDQETLADQAVLMAREVVGLQFRYFDGVEWFEDWDPALNSGLPQAVEIALELQSPDSKQRSERSRDAVKPTSRFYTLAVAVPAAKPYVPPLE